jgi:C4-dicarboxylate-specific signal transduction histidine kinase
LAAVLFLPILEYRFEHFASSLGVLSLVGALSLASVVTISYSFFTAITFQWLLTLPNTVFLFYLWYADRNSAALHAAIMLTILLVYSYRQTRHIHRENVRRMSYAIDLERSNRLLVESQDLLIQEKAKLQHSIKLAAIGEISAEIAHEINNPLGIMNGYIELSLDLLKSNAPDKDVLQAQLMKARSAISRITKIIKGLRHYSRRTNDDPLVPVFVNEIIEDAVEFCSEKFNYNKTALEIDNPVDYRLLCRPIEISQVLLNIFSNGIDEVSKLDPEVRKIKVIVISVDGIVKISISNYGPKIKPEVQEKLFEPFFSTKKIGIGTGLGLSISRGIIESYRGRLYYDPLPEQTTFVIELPLHLEA